METGTDRRPTVLVLLGCFRDAHEATGPSQSMIGMARLLGRRFRFRVLADDPAPALAGWTEVAGVEQRSLAQGRFGARGLRAALRATPHDILVMNSIFCRQLTVPALIMRRLGLVPRKPALLAPRGEFSPGALALKPGRKRFYLALLRRLRLLDGVAIQATTGDEAAMIRQAFPAARIVLGPNVRTLGPLPPHSAGDPSAPLRIAFLSRIDRKKNLDFALRCLDRSGIRADFSIYGPVTHAEHWAECERIIAAMPDTVRVTYHGAIGQQAVPEALARHDLFFLPTRGENYGHAIVDALAAGLPVLLSDQVPWRGLEEAGAGWTLPLDDEAAFIAVLREMAARSPDERRAARLAARAYVEDQLAKDGAVAALEACFAQLLGSGAGAGTETVPQSISG